MFDRPTNIKLFDPKSPEYELCNHYIKETMDIVSPDILWFSHLVNDTKSDMDELDDLYQEAGSAIRTYKEPVKVSGYVEISPIIQELAQLGVSELLEVNLIMNADDTAKRLNELPKEGDIFRVSYIELNQLHKHVFYNVGTVLPSDLYNFMYMNLIITGEQTSMADVPREVKNFLKLE